ncbi:MAG: tetraacyldisaccharide 4'-kinase [Syntrophobacteraceae bacterium]
MSATPAPLQSRVHRSATSWLSHVWNEPSRPSLLNPAHAVLWLASGGYRAGLSIDQWLKRRKRLRLPVCVVSVGNLVVGGTGKTPFTLWLAETLAGAGIGVAILSRGYGRQEDRVARVPSTPSEWREAAALYGDEPVLLAGHLPSVPIWVGRNRFAAGQMAIEHDLPSVVILDDGFQHVSLHRDVDLVLLDAGRPFGNGRLLPMGPLREPIHSLSRAHALVLTRATDKAAMSKARAILEKDFPGKPVFASHHRITGISPAIGCPGILSEDLANKVSIAFAGIARPESFLESLRTAVPGLRLAETYAFPDHHAFTAAETDWLLDRKRRCGADLLVTTEKDWVRLPASFRSQVFVATMDLDFGDDHTPLKDYLLRQIEDHLPPR